MSEGRVERRLAAILAVDVVGYSRLMGADEEGTLAALRSMNIVLIRSDLGLCYRNARRQYRANPPKSVTWISAFERRASDSDAVMHRLN
ncbi:MAG: hypothetical protein WBF03_00890 [Xanthobacteraceae bacterium]